MKAAQQYDDQQTMNNLWAQRNKALAGAQDGITKYHEGINGVKDAVGEKVWGVIHKNRAKRAERDAQLVQKVKNAKTLTGRAQANKDHIELRKYSDWRPTMAMAAAVKMTNSMLPFSPGMPKVPVL